MQLSQAGPQNAASDGDAEVRASPCDRSTAPPRAQGPNAAAAACCCRTMLTQLITHERIETTLPRAKELRRLADQVVTLGKQVCACAEELKLQLVAFAPVRCQRDVSTEPALMRSLWPIVQNTLQARRQAAGTVKEDAALHKLFTEFAERYRERQGGYTRVLQTRRRPNDAAQMAYIECVTDRPLHGEHAAADSSVADSSALVHEW